MIFSPVLRRLRIVPILALLVVLTPAYSTVRAPAYPDPVRATNGMVVSAHQLASEAGVEILEKGGNAVDASVATGFALAVVYPVAGNLGGGGFMVIRHHDGTTTTFDYREKAPAAATRDMYLDENGVAVAAWSRHGHLASGVPGAVAGLLAAHAKYGSLPLDAVIAPAVRLAEKGYLLTLDQADRFNQNVRTFSDFEGTRRYFTKGDLDTPYEEGERFIQRDLAAVLKRIQKDGRNGFYRGRTAELIVAEMQRGDGLITLADLEAYEAVERPPVTGTYRGYRVLSMAPPSSGGIALIQLLNAVEPYDLNEMGVMASETLHLMGEAMRRVYADRAEWLGDPDYYTVPTDGLLDKAYMRARMESFNPYRADTSARLGHGDPYAYESTETTHYSVVDAEGNAVSTTTTLNGSYGSKVVVDGAGFFMNNEMDDFSAKPGVPNMFGLVGTEANAIQPGKRMLSSMTPTLLEDPEGRLFMIIGAPGGATIITTVFQIITNVVDHGMNIQEAISAPRVHHQWLPDEFRYERYALPRDVVRNLQMRGWTVNGGTSDWGRAHGITVHYNLTEARNDDAGRNAYEVTRDARVYLGGVDPRGDGAAAGY